MTRKQNDTMKLSKERNKIPHEGGDFPPRRQQNQPNPRKIPQVKIIPNVSKFCLKCMKSRTLFGATCPSSFTSLNRNVSVVTTGPTGPLSPRAP